MERVFNVEQDNFFGLLCSENSGAVNANENVVERSVESFRFDFKKYTEYDLEKYKLDVLEQGLKVTWDNIRYYVLYGDKNNSFLSLDNLAELYEIGLAICDKKSKKDSGQYYTPNDVASVMASWLVSQQGENVCDVGCGTGRLILTYFDIIGKQNAKNLIRSGKVYLYDIDSIALDICKTIILAKYGKDLAPFINCVCNDFLSEGVCLPKNCKVISNPPYAAINRFDRLWELSDVLFDTKELYAAFMEKIMRESRSSVIITPYSFVGGSKFFSLRKFMNNYNGFIVSFDNVPGNIFCGKKLGVFNTNTANSVRAAITVVENKEKTKGFRLSPLIRFKNEERARLLKTETLESFIDDRYQTVSINRPMYCKCFKGMLEIWQSWYEKSNKSIGDYVGNYGRFVLSVPNTCRYYTVAANGKLKRSGQIVLNFENEDVFNFVFCLINSSFAYWYWRMFDGGVTFQKGLLLDMPVFFDLLTAEDKSFFNEMAGEMINNAGNYIVTKNNIGVQENIKYPKEIRDVINKKLLEVLNVKTNERIFDLVHSNVALGK